MAAKTYYRIEENKRAVGCVIKRSGPPPLAQHYAVVECILENRRPVKCLSRSQSVYMREDRDFSTMGIKAFANGYVHQLEPRGPVEARDVKWIGALQARHPKKGISLPDKYEGVSDDELADRYWNGEWSATPSVEHVTKEAEVVSVEEALSPVSRPKLGEALKQVAAYDKKIVNL